jgi:uncharacterized RDD family membrane protein YckC
MEFLPLELDGQSVYAGFWKRLAALLIDGLLFIPFTVAWVHLQDISMGVSIAVFILSALLYPLYSVYFHYRFGATVGKMVLGIKVTLPDGSPITLKEALLRSSVDIAFALAGMAGTLIALSHADPQTYLSVTWQDRARYLLHLYPLWYKPMTYLSRLWMFGDFLALLFNRRKRALHDFIAGTVVIQEKVLQQRFGSSETAPLRSTLPSRQAE